MIKITLPSYKSNPITVQTTLMVLSLRLIRVANLKALFDGVENRNEHRNKIMRCMFSSSKQRSQVKIIELAVSQP